MTTIRRPPLPTIRELLKLYNTRALKKLSQNFLLNLRLTDKIVKAARSNHQSEWCEVGPGPGGITRSILARDPAKIVVVEKDKRFKPMLENLAESAYCPLELVFGDVLDFDMSNLFTETLKKDWNDAPPSIHLVGNLPFNVSTILIIRWLQEISLRKSAWCYGRVRMTLTFQEEVAERMVAMHNSKVRCRLSVMCQNWCDVHHCFTIPGKAFLPKPEVNVGVVHFTPLREPLIPLEFSIVEKVLQVMFNGRQKYAYKTAGNLFPISLREQLTQELFNHSNVSSVKRPFQLTNEEWQRICIAYKGIIDHNPAIYHYNYRGERCNREEIWKTHGQNPANEENVAV